MESIRVTEEFHLIIDNANIPYKIFLSEIIDFIIK